MKVLLPLASLLATSVAHASPVVPGTLSTVATQQSIGIEWQVSGDTNHTAFATVSYRRQGASTWRSGFELMRVDFAGANTVAGSVLFLEPGTHYELQLSLSDPDGGGTVRNVVVTTRSEPVKPLGGATLHVSAGATGGDGSAGQPFGSLTQAQAVADPGDTILIHAGTYSNVVFTASGNAAAYLVFQAAGDGEVTIRGASVSGDHLWIEGLTFRDRADALTTAGSPQDVVVNRNTFVNNHYSIDLRGGGYGWTITDNVIEGDNDYQSGSFSGEGIELWRTSGHVVAHNRISNTADGISYPESDVDIYGNDIFDTSDDGIEGDNGRANVRVWGNRLQNTLHNGFSFQNQEGGPWYLIRNLIVNFEESALKYRTTDRHVLVHNTFINWNEVVDHWGQNILNAYSRNNLFVSVNGGIMFQMIYPGFNFPVIFTNWRTDLDYDGFDWSGYEAPFEYHGTVYPDLGGVQAGTGLWPNAIEIDGMQCLPELGLVTGPAPTRVPPMHARLQSPCAAIDAGVAVANLSEQYVGSAPDLGAYEFGAALPWYGPRPVAADADADTVTDDLDNCTLAANPDQRDTDGDDFGNVCDADLDQNCSVNAVDLGILRTRFFTADPDADFDGDGIVNAVDLGVMKALFFAPPGPSGLAIDCTP